MWRRGPHETSSPKGKLLLQWWGFFHTLEWKKNTIFHKKENFASAPLQVFWRLSRAQFGHPYVTRVYKWHERAMWPHHLLFLRRVPILGMELFTAPHRARGTACISHIHCAWHSASDILKSAFAFGDCTKWTFREEWIKWGKKSEHKVFLGSFSY